MEGNAEFTHFNALLLVLTEIVLPTVDVISDVLLIIQLTTYDVDIKSCPTNDPYCMNYNTLGYLMMIPLSLSIILFIPHWWKEERTRKMRLLTAPLLLLQCWPQYRALRILWLKYKKKNVQLCIEELSVIKGTVGTIGEL